MITRTKLSSLLLLKTVQTFLVHRQHRQNRLLYLFLSNNLSHTLSNVSLIESTATCVTTPNWHFSTLWRTIRGSKYTTLSHKTQLSQQSLLLFYIIHTFIGISLYKLTPSDDKILFCNPLSKTNQWRSWLNTIQSIQPKRNAIASQRKTRKIQEKATDSMIHLT